MQIVPTNTLVTPLPTSTPAKAVRNSLMWDAIRRLKRNKVAMVSFVVICIYVLIALGAKLGLLFPNVAVSDTANQYLPILTWDHPFGTDVLGRDILARAVHGTATALSVGLIASGISLLIGLTLGAIAGYYGGWVDGLIVWLYTTIDSIPYILLIPAITWSVPERASDWSVDSSAGLEVCRRISCTCIPTSSGWSPATRFADSGSVSSSTSGSGALRAG